MNEVSRRQNRTIHSLYYTTGSPSVRDCLPGIRLSCQYTFGVERIEGNADKLKKLYDHGYKHALWAMDKLKAYLEK